MTLSRSSSMEEPGLTYQPRYSTGWLAMHDIGSSQGMTTHNGVDALVLCVCFLLLQIDKEHVVCGQSDVVQDSSIKKVIYYFNYCNVNNFSVYSLSMPLLF